MLLQFSVENYRSIKDKMYLSLDIDNDSEHPENIATQGNFKTINTIIIYGANASGKSNLFKAMAVAVNMIRNSNTLQITSRLPVVPFKFDSDSITKPTSFEFIFIASNGLKYIYGFSATKEAITEEYLYCYKSSRGSLIFERHAGKDPEYKFSRTSVAKMTAAAQMNTANKLFLPTATSWNVQETKPALEWLNSFINTYYGQSRFISESLNQYRLDSDDSIKSFTQKLLKETDINISKVSVNTRTYNDISQVIDNDLPSFNDLIFSNSDEIHEVQINTEHSIKTEDGKMNLYSLPLKEESQGTQQIVYFGPLLKDTFDQGKVLVIDEIDNSLHPFIVRYIINLFRNPIINRNGAQLIVTTHETTLLSLDVFRRDQIYFTEKDGNTGITDLYSLNDFSVRKDENIQKGYLLGRYGAIPYLFAEKVF